MSATQQLAVTRHGTEQKNEPTLVLMHFLGGSGREWDEVLALLPATVSAVTIDLPGFGGSSEITGYTVTEMADAVHATVQNLGLTRYVLVGHSMSGKVSAVLARRAQEAGQPGLEGLVLVAPSPPSPEPMTDEKRASMIASLGERHDDDLVRAHAYITKNDQRDLPKEVEDRAAQEVLRMDRTAWVAWLTHGSKEDWAGRVGVLDLPALVVAGEKDTSLGPDAQTQFTLPHLAKVQLKTIPGCSHLVPMERPAEMAALLQEFLVSLKRTPVPAEYLDFIAGERVSPKTREVLEARMQGPTPGESIFTADQVETLRAMIARVLPQDAAAGEIDLTGFVLARLASGKGDGWRFADLPEDPQAYSDGLDLLLARGFTALTPAEQDAMLHQLETEGIDSARWFEEVRGDVVSAYMAHPATLARIGYSGIGVGGAHTKYKGFVSVGPDEREGWEPLPMLTEVQR